MESNFGKCRHLHSEKRRDALLEAPNAHRSSLKHITSPQQVVAWIEVRRSETEGNLGKER